MNTTSNTYNNNTNGTGKGKFKPYRNRPGKRQSLLELLSVLILIVSVPCFLGGLFSIFIAIAAFCLGIIGLFAWTRRHARLFSLLAICLIAGCIVNIILRATFHAQCVPFFEYRNQFAAVAVPVPIVFNNGTSNNNGTVNNNNGTNFVIVNGTDNGVNNGTDNGNNNGVNNGTNSGSSNGVGGVAAGAFVGGSTINGNRNEYNQSIWCGNNYIVYITHAILILLAALALLCALAALRPRNKTPVAARTTEATSTHTRTTATENY